MADKNKGGRPLKFESAEALWKVFEEYKSTCLDLKKTVQDKKTKQVYEIDYDKPITLVGFCAHAGIHRDTLNEYKNNRPEFSDIIKDIYQECEADLVTKALMYEAHADFAYRLLKNAHGYIDKQEIEAKSENHNYNYTDAAKRFWTNATDEERKRYDSGDMTLKEQEEIINRG